MVNTLSCAAVFKIHILFQDCLCIKKILVNTYDTKFDYNVYFGFWHFIKILSQKQTSSWHHYSVKGQGNSLAYMCTATNQPPAQGSFHRSVKFRHTDRLTSSRNCFHHITMSGLCEQ